MKEKIESFQCPHCGKRIVITHSVISIVIAKPKIEIRKEG